jgi:hypothetical protein
VESAYLRPQFHDKSKHLHAANVIAGNIMMAQMATEKACNLNKT